MSTKEQTTTDGIMALYERLPIHMKLSVNHMMLSITHLQKVVHLTPEQKAKFYDELMEITLPRLAARSAKGGSNE